ncbi:MAG TPA: glucose 1-dehydrogenase [Candidatus Saccharimonadales bacterium]|nr:glucose 1-dehydrogenase [Candidatus Saccharimonadales bacterium]
MNNGTMRAVGVIPAKREVALFQHASPHVSASTELKVRTLEVGICGTDREICSFAYGTPPNGCDYLVLGHEALGEVVEVGPSVRGFKPGDLVVPTVRRPCPHDHCPSCREARQDFCWTGDFTERGIKMTHGYMTEYFVEDQQHLNLVPTDLADVAVLVEPLTVAEKALAQVWQVQQRLPWNAPGADTKLRGAGKTAVVLGAGPVGILGAMALLVNGFKTYVYSRSAQPNPKADLVNSIGAEYISSDTTSLEKFAAKVGNIDLVYEAVGVARISFDVMKVLALNGVFVFTGIPPHKPAIPIEADSLMRQVVLMNQAIIGTVNADRPAFENAIRDLGIFKKRWPEALPKVITGRHPLENYRELLLGKATGIKNVITMAG